jgi:hypothetical protein
MGQPKQIMATITLSRPDMQARSQARLLTGSDLAREMVALIGRKLSAYIAGVKDVRSVDRWIGGGQFYGDAEERLRFGYQVVRMLSDFDKPSVVQAWLMGINPELGDRAPIKLIREYPIAEIAPQVLGAARAFVAGG